MWFRRKTSRKRRDFRIGDWVVLSWDSSREVGVVVTAEKDEAGVWFDTSGLIDGLSKASLRSAAVPGRLPTGLNPQRARRLLASAVGAADAEVVVDPGRRRAARWTRAAEFAVRATRKLARKAAPVARKAEVAAVAREARPEAPQVEVPRAHIRHARFDLNPWTESLDARRAAIQGVVAERGISALYHFTRIENVPSILELGLLPRNRLPPEALVSDDRRLDQREDTCSVSISHPNALMFYAKRTQTGDERWAVLELEPSVLWEKPCLFFTRNAATCGGARTPDCDIETSWALREMFRRRDETASLADFLTTDPQAEVLVRGPIERRYIRRAHVLGSTWGPEHAIPGIAWARTPALFHVHPAY